jgi:fused signal recognition particle receptor
LIAAAVVAAGVIVTVSNYRHRRELLSQPRDEITGSPDDSEVPGQPPASPAKTGEPTEAGEQAAEDKPLPADQPPAEPAAPTTEAPEATGTRLARLRRRLASSNNALARGLADLLSSDRIDAETWDDFEATLITSDLGVGPTTELVEKLRQSLAIDGVRDPDEAKRILRQELVSLVDPSLDRSLNLTADDNPTVAVMMVGVNGTGKTTTVGKLARVLVAEHKSVLLAAADTFRAAAADQLQTWGERIGVSTVRGAEGADPASVAFEAAKQAQSDGVEVVLVDTAGRLHTKVGLMDELGKVKRVIEKTIPVTETLLVIDATTGQNGLAQARIFAQAVNITGLVLTKLDGSAKGGIVVQVQRELGVPVKLIGLGEGVDDLAPFDPEQFVDGLLGD